MKLLKKIIWCIASPLLTLIVGVVVFFFWASAANWKSEQYAQTKTIKLSEHDLKPVSDTFSIMTYNLGYLSGMLNNTTQVLTPSFVKENLNRISSHLRNMQLDYLALQEVDFYANRTHYMDQLVALASAIQLPHLAYAVNWDKRYLPFPYSWKAHFGQLVSGQAMLSSKPILKNKRLVLDKVESQPAYYQAFYLDRLAQTVVTKRGDKKIALLNVHLDHSDEVTRNKQADKVLRLFAELENQFDAVILLGDFNSYLHSPNEKNPVVGKFFGNPNLQPVIPKSEIGNPNYFTFDSQKPYEMIDYIFFNPKKLQCIEWGRVNEVGQSSDHLPIYAKFVFPTSAVEN